MAVEKEENQANAHSEEPITPETADSRNELREKIWSVVSFEKLEAGSLTYAEAEQKIAELEAQKFSGLCIVTDEVAARIAAKK